MKKGYKKRSFARRLTRRLVFTLLIVMGIASSLIFLTGGVFVIINECMRHETMLKALEEYVEHVASDVYVGTINQVPEVEENIDRPEQLMKIAERVVLQNPRIHSCGISFVENYYPQKGRSYMPYAVRRDSTTIEVVDSGPQYQDYLREEWFLQALKANKGYWSEPFFEGKDTLSPLVAYIHPIHDKQGRTVAIIGADISLHWLQEKMGRKDMKVYSYEWTGTSEGEILEKEKAGKSLRWKPYCILISSKGTFIVHPDKKRIIRDNISSIVKASTDTITATICRQMMEGKSSADCFKDSYCESGDFDGHDCYVFFMPIEHTNWSLALVVPYMTIDLIAYIVGGMLVFLIITALIVVWLVSRFTIRRTVKPLKQLASSAHEVAKGNFNTPLPTIKHNDEIRQLRDSFEDMQHSLTNYIEELKDTTASKAAIEKELKVAHDIQMAMLPKVFPPYPERNDLDIYGQLTPAKDVGGDLFDFYIRDNHLFFCIGDVSGKGVPASLVMAVTRSLFRNISAHTSEPEIIITALNEALTEGNDTNMFVTIFVGVLNLANGQLLYCNAGHNAPFLIGQGVGMVPCDSNLPIGIMSDWKYSLQELTIEHQITIFLYTDGLNEAENSEHIQFGIQRIRIIAEKLLATGNNQPATILNNMTVAVHTFVSDAEQSDDLTMLAIKYL